MSMHVTLVLIAVDIPGSGLPREGRHDPRTGQWILPPSRHAGVHGVHALARQLSTTPDLINYKRRGDALQAWCIDPATWQDIISQPPGQRAVPARAERLEAPVRLRGRLDAHHPGQPGHQKLCIAPPGCCHRSWCQVAPGM